MLKEWITSPCRAVMSQSYDLRVRTLNITSSQDSAQGLVLRDYHVAEPRILVKIPYSLLAVSQLGTDPETAGCLIT
jgi:hypothetical protein